MLPLLYCPMTWGNLPVGSWIRCAATSCRSKIHGHHLAFQIVYWNILAIWNPPIYYDFLLSYWWSWTAWWGMYHIAFQLLGDLWMLLGLLIMAFAPMVPMAAFYVAPKLLISSSGTDKPQNWSAVDLHCCQLRLRCILPLGHTTALQGPWLIRPSHGSWWVNWAASSGRMSSGMDGLEVRMEAQKRLIMNSLPKNHIFSNIYVCGWHSASLLEAGF